MPTGAGHRQRRVGQAGRADRDAPSNRADTVAAGVSPTGPPVLLAPVGRSVSAEPTSATAVLLCVLSPRW
jgi:hypothetical protein